MSDYLHKQVLTPGQTFGKYQIVKLLGKGGMGEVYLATDSFLDRRVAIKVLPLKRTADPLFRERMQREAAAGARVEHPHLVRIYDGGVTADDVVFVVMEDLGEHKTLRYLVYSSAPFLYGQWLRIGIEIADGLMACHLANIVHRDLKPENIVVLPGGHVKIIDFGLAKIRSSAIRTTMGDRKIATPLYASPEQLLGPSKEVSEKADIWAFGCVLYEMAVGRQIWQTITGDFPSPQQATWAVQSRQPPKLAESDLSLPAGLSDLVDRCFDRDPTKRPSALDLARGLRQFLATPPKTATTDPMSSGYPVRSPEPPRIKTSPPHGSFVGVAGQALSPEEASTEEVPKSAVTDVDPFSVKTVDSDPNATRFGEPPLNAIAPGVPEPAKPAPEILQSGPNAILPAPKAAPKTMQSAAPFAPVMQPATPPGFRPVPRTIQMATVNPAPRTPSIPVEPRVAATPRRGIVRDPRYFVPVLLGLFCGLFFGFVCAVVARHRAESAKHTREVVSPSPTSLESTSPPR